MSQRFLRLAMLVAAALSPITTAAAQVHVVPEHPSNLTPVTIHYTGVHHSSAYPIGHALKREGNVIRVELRFSSGRISVAGEYRHAVHVGVLEPGDYEIRTPEFNNVTRVQVRDATTFVIEPPGSARWAGCPRMISHAPRSEGSIRIGTQEVYYNGAALDRPIELPPGVYDITSGQYASPSESFVARNAYVVYDADGCYTWEPRVWEEVLVPVFWNGAGGTGTWTSQLALWSSTREPVQVVAPDYSGLPSGDLELLDVENEPLDVPPSFGQYPHGVVLHVGRGAADRLHGDLKIRDVLGETTTAVRVPVVREKDMLRTTSRIDDVPEVPGARVLLRLYTTDDRVNRFVVRSSSHPMSAAPVRHAPHEPRVATIDVTEHLATQTRPNRSLLIHADADGLPYYALLTITDPRTRQMTILTAQPAEFFSFR